METKLGEAEKMRDELMGYSTMDKNLDDLQFFTYEELARILKVKRTTVHVWVYRGLIRRTVRMGKNSLIPKVEFERFMKERMKIHESKAFRNNGGAPKPLKSSK